MGGVVVLHAVKTHHRRPAVAEGPQAQVDAEHKAVDRMSIDRLGQPLPQAGKELFVADATRAVAGLAVFREGIDKVDIGGVIQFIGTQFAHPQDHQLLRDALWITGRPPLPALPRVQYAQCQVDAGIGEIRKVAHGFIEVGPAGDITPGDTHHLAAA